MIAFNEGEEVVLEVRRHWIVLAPFLLATALAVVLPLVLYGIVDALPVTFQAAGWGPALPLFAYCAWLLALWVGGYFVWLDHHLDIWILTTERLIDVEQKGLFRREVSSLRLDRVQDITAEVNGLVATYLNFGDVTVQNAGDTPEFTMTRIDKPQRLVDAMNAELSKRGKMVRIEL
jgi:hypothetical protein